MLAARTAMANTAVTVVDMEGELDITTAIDFDSFLKELINQKRHKLVLNMNRLNYISSSGFGTLTSVTQNVRNNKGDIKIANVTLDVYETFNTLEFHKIFQILKTEDDAVREF